MKTHDELKEIQLNICKLRILLTVRREMLDKMNLVIFETEQRWNYLMKLQVKRYKGTTKLLN